MVGWLHRVTLNLCFDRKRRFRVITTPDLPDIEDDAPLADRLIEADQAREEMASALDALPERYRAALVLCYFEGFSNAAAADMLDLNIKAMESLLPRTNRLLVASSKPHAQQQRMAINRSWICIIATPTSLRACLVISSESAPS